MRSLLLALLLASLASTAVAQDWGKLATISGTMGVSDSRLCLGKGSRGDIGCPMYAPYVSAAGYVGIGSQAPTAMLTISGSTYGGVGIQINNSSTQGNAVIGFNRGSGNNSSIGPLAGSSGLSIYTLESQGIKLDTGSGSPTERMRITQAGLVGIGTTNPNAALEVSGTISATHFVGDGSGLTGIATNGDRIISSSVSAVAEQTSGTVRVSGTLAMNNTGNEPCDAAHAFSLRINPTTKFVQMCRP